MKNRVYRFAETKIFATKAFYIFFALFAPIAAFIVIVNMDVAFDNAVVLLAALLALLVVFISYHEGKVAINTLRKHRVEINDEHLIKVCGKRKELILYGDINHVEVVKGLTGKVKEVSIVTPYRKMTIKDYDALDQLVSTLEVDKGILVKG